MKSLFPSGKEQMSAVWSYPSCFFLGLKFLLMLVNKISDVVSKGWFSLAHKHNISITSENTRDISISRNIRRTNPLICLMLFSLANKHKHKHISISTGARKTNMFVFLVSACAYAYGYVLVFTSENGANISITGN